MITPVLLCGGSGTRLWPLSRKSMPKQFAHVLGEESLFKASARRFRGADFTDPLILTGHDFRFIVSKQLEEVAIAPNAILIEPEGRNTAAAAIAAALLVARQDPEAMLLLVPSDQAINDPEEFRAAVLRGAVAAEAGDIITFGIKATRPETGYGWLEAGAETHPGVNKLTRFIEKPNAEKAATLLENPANLWNAGVFLARADVLIAAFEAHAPEILATVGAALDAGTTDLGFMVPDAALWHKVPEDSIDYAVMEKAANVSVVRFDGHWSDLGSWEAVWQESPKDDNGNALSEHTTAIDCAHTLLRSEDDDIEIVGIGLENTVAIAMRDAVMVADISNSQAVKTAVTLLKERKARQAQHFPVDHRPWGWYETLVIGDRFQVKRIHVHPGEALSLQHHHHRSEHWIVVQGTALVTVNDTESLIGENQSVYIPLGAKHRLENPGKLPMVLIEVQTGSYLGEDDIVRHEDKYART